MMLRALLTTLACGGVAAGAWVLLGALAPAAAVRLPEPKLQQEAAPTQELESAVLAGGCFWGVQAVFQHVQGVQRAVSGYAGGSAQDARYESVTTGRSGHAEAVRIEFDPRQISYARILQIHFSVAHDPTQRDRQGPDWGPQYRSAIFPQSQAQERIARDYIAQLDGARVLKNAIATTIEPQRPFFEAEPYHQDYLVRHPTQPYIVHNDLPKLEALQRLFPEVYQPQPALVNP